MKTIAERLAGIFRSPERKHGPVVRGRVHRISRVAGGDLSVIVRFGMEEPGALRLLQGDAVELCGVLDRTPPASPTRSSKVQTAAEPGMVVDLDPDEVTFPVPVLTDVVEAGPVEPARGAVHEDPDQCNCGTQGGHPHEPDCPWWLERDAEALYAREKLPADPAWAEISEAMRGNWRSLVRDRYTEDQQPCSETTS